MLLRSVSPLAGEAPATGFAAWVCGAFTRPAKKPSAANTTEAAKSPEIHGHSGVDCVCVIAVGVPHAWQKRAPALRGALHEAHAAEVSGAAQLLQKRPDAGWPHFGQLVVVIFIGFGSETLGG